MLIESDFQVVQLELMTAAGEIISCGRDKNKEIFLTVLCGIGATGVILTLTLQCEPVFKLCQKEKISPLDVVSCSYFLKISLHK